MQSITDLLELKTIFPRFKTRRRGKALRSGSNVGTAVISCQLQRLKPSKVAENAKQHIRVEFTPTSTLTQVVLEIITDLEDSSAGAQ
ncbi:hypothetical protein [Aestuariivirga sp.]|uniref:hypothetical protein n=1 Tax=Aestuariivirga sp. TaxID=2650926 RepID=UPI003BA8B5B9